MKKLNQIIPVFIAFIAFGFFASTPVSAQKFIKVNGIAEYKDAPLGNVEITITKDGEEVGKFSTDEEGDFYVELETNSNYTFRAKKNGYIVRYLIFSTHFGEGDKPKKKFNFGLTMFKEGNSRNPKTAYDIPLVKYDEASKKFQYLENF